MIAELNKRYKPLIWVEPHKGWFVADAETYRVTLDLPKESGGNWRARLEGISIFTAFHTNYFDALDIAFAEAIYQNQFQIDQITRLFSVLKKQNGGDNPNEASE
jgi:hypothetical protein